MVYWRCLLWSLVIALVLTGSAASGTVKLDAKVVASYDYTFQDKWYFTAGENIPSLTSATEFAYGQSVWIYVFLTGYKTSNQKAKLKYDLNIISPSGEVIENLVGLLAVDNKIDNPKYVQLARTVVQFVATPDKPLGEYTFKATAYDIVAGKECMATTVADLVRFELQPKPWTFSEFEFWMLRYHQKPDPFKAGELFLSVVANGYPENAFTPLFAFFLELYQHNRWQIPFLLDRFHDSSPVIRSHLGWLVRLLDYQDSVAFDRLDQSDRDFITALALPPIPEMDVEVTSAPQLDWLWGTFFASGGLEPIRKLAGALELQKYESNYVRWVENYQKTNTAVEPDNYVMFGTTFRAARWSLSSNCAQHDLVKSYCQYLINEKSLGKTAKYELKKILKP